MTEPIASKQNQYVKLAKSLAVKKYRDLSGLFFAEGIRTVEELSASWLKIDYVLFSQEILSDQRGQLLLLEIQHQDIPCWPVAEGVFRDLCGTETPQGIAAVVRIPTWDLADLQQHGGMLLVIDGVQDPGNLGTMLRTAWAAGAAGVVAVNGAVDYFNPKTVRASMGAVFNLPLVKSTTETLLEFLPQNGYRILVADLSGEQYYFQCTAAGRVAWVLGSEAMGPDPQWLAKADAVVKIPLPGGAESLNVAVAAGILLYESVRQSEIVKALNSESD